MRLLTRLKRIEKDRAAVAAEAQALALMPVGVLWDCDAERLVDVDLRDGDELVRDYWILGAGDGATLARSRERVTREAADRGVVYDAGDCVIGRVVEDDGSDVVVLEYDRAAVQSG